MYKAESVCLTTISQETVAMQCILRNKKHLVPTSQLVVPLIYPLTTQEFSIPQLELHTFWSPCREFNSATLILTIMSELSASV